ncbi:MAG: hypothetical protein ACLFU8_17015, partial [Anaerolineales bacterium]
MADEKLPEEAANTEVQEAADAEAEGSVPVEAESVTEATLDHEKATNSEMSTEAAEEVPPETTGEVTDVEVAGPVASSELEEPAEAAESEAAEAGVAGPVASS